MGADFVQKATSTFKKSWDKGRLALATADLFTRSPTCVACSAPFDIIGDARLQAGDRVTVEKGEGCLIARQRLTEVARISNPPDELMRAIEASCGIAKGTVELMHDLSGVAEISLC